MNDQHEPITLQSPYNESRPIRLRHMYQLINSIKNFSLVVMIADAGYGKPQIANHLIIQSNACPAWISLTDADNLIQGFWQKFLSSGIMRNIRTRRILEDLGFPHSQNELDFVLEKISQNLLLGNKIILVFDRFEVIYRAEIIEFIEKLAQLQLSNLQIIILSKKIPEIAITKLVLKNILIPITQDEIRFTKEEFLELHALTAPVDKTQPLEAIYDYFEGKPVPLIMACYYDSTNNSPLDPLDLDNPMFWEQSIVDYFGHHVPLIFILYLGIFHCFDEDIWNAIPIPHSYTYERFIDSNALTAKIPGTQTYEFHDFYQEIYSERFHALDPDLQLEIYSFAAHYYMKKENLTESILMFQKAKEYDTMLQLLQKLFISNSSEYDYPWFINRIETLPTEVLHDYPEIQLIYSALLFIGNRKKDAQLQCDTLIDRYKGINIDPERKNTVLGEAYTLKGIHAIWNLDADMDRYFHAATKYLANGTWLFSNYLSFESHVIPLYNQSPSDERWFITLSTALAKAKPYMASILHGRAAGLDLLFDAQYFYQIGKLDESEVLLQKCINESSINASYGVEFNAHVILLQIYLARGDRSNTQSIFKIIEQRVNSLNYPSLSSYFKIVKAKFYILLGETAKIPAWVSSGSFSNYHIWGSITWHEHYLYALFLYRGGNYAELEDFMPTLEQIIYVHHGNRYTNYLECYLLKALLMLALKKEEEATAILENIYHNSPFKDYTMRFAEYGMAMAQLIDVAKQNPSISIPTKWLDYMHAEAKKYNTLNKCSNSLIDVYRLTRKEIEILELLAKGMSDAEIAKKAVTTVATVKWYNRQIYSKLDVKNRTEAARLVLEAGLIFPQSTIIL